MSMRRPPHAQPTLKHLAFFEEISAHEEKSPDALAATAGLLILRMMDHWELVGGAIVEPDAISVRSTRAAIMEIASGDPIREVFVGIVNAMQTLGANVQRGPLRPRLMAYAALLEQREKPTLAVDVYDVVVSSAMDDDETDLQYDAWMRIAHCQRELGRISEADRAYTAATTIARRIHDMERLLRARLGVASITMTRHEVEKTIRIFDEVDAELRTASLATEVRQELQASVLHARSVVATRERALDDALRFAHQALALHTAPIQRDRVLAQIASILLTAERFEAARDALLIVELTTIREETRTRIRGDLLSLAARSGDRLLFERMRSMLGDRPLPAVVRANFLIESARGFRRFNDPARAEGLLREAVEFARTHQLEASRLEAEALLAGREPYPTPTLSERALTPGFRDVVEQELRDELAALPRP